SDPKLKVSNATRHWLKDVERRVTLTVDEKKYEVVFPTFEQSQMALRTLADWVVRLRLLKVAGVAQVVTVGGGRKQYQILVNAEELTRYRVSLDDVTAALEKNNQATSGGWAIEGDREKPIRFLGRLGPRDDQVLTELENIPVRRTDARNILLK